MNIYRVIGRKGTKKRWHFRNGVLITLGILLVLFGFWICFFSDWLPAAPVEVGATMQEAAGSSQFNPADPG